MSTTPPPSFSSTRRLLLIVASLLALALLGSSIANFVTARRASSALARARAHDMVINARLALRAAMMNSSSLPDQTTLHTVLDELEDRGLSYLALTDGAGRILVSIGVPLPPPTALPPRGRGPALLEVGDKLSLQAPLRGRWGSLRGRGSANGRGGGRGFGRGNGRGAGRGLGRGAGGGGGRGAGGGGGRGAGGGGGRGAGGGGGRGAGPGGRPVAEQGATQGFGAQEAYQLRLGFSPVLAAAIKGGAARSLVISAVIAGFMLLGGGLFWRLSRRAEAGAEQLARDEHLKALGTMSAVLGHELRNPLASLKGHAQMLQEKLAGHQALPNAEQVVHEAVRLEALTTAVLDFVRTGTVALTLSDVSPTLTAAIQAVDDPRVTLDAPADLPHIMLDAPRLEQALVNLLTNALAASTDDGVVTLAARPQGDQLVITVRDVGPGLGQIDPASLFEPFVTTRVKGTGLGLAITQRIIQAHGGMVTAQDAAGGGALLTVTLPTGARRQP